MERVSFMDGNQYTAREFRRWFGTQQDGIKGFATTDAFTVSAGNGVATVNPGIGFAQEQNAGNREQGLYQIIADQVMTVPYSASDSYIWIMPNDKKDYDTEADLESSAHMRLLVRSDRNTPSPRALLLARVLNHQASDERTSPGSGQFIITRSGPARYGAPGSSAVPLSDLAHLSLGTQYTDLATGQRWVRVATTNTAGDWFRDQGEVGPTGPRGVQGLTGAAGPRGETGAKGDLGDLTTGYPHDIKVTEGKTLLLDQVDVKAALAKHDQELVSAKSDIGTLNGKVRALETAVSDLQGKVSPGVSARSNGLSNSTHNNAPLYWTAALALNGFKADANKGSFECKTPGRYAISVTASTSVTGSSTGTRIHLNVNGSDQYQGSFATTGGRPSCGVMVTLYDGDRVSVSFTSNTRMSVTSEETFLSITKLG
ncbi:hypothetical protein [Streptomyces sp. NPDC056883]|uniref:C1q-like domain-containing protein n=1 Tax=Streptomyces sp. NPDC056883 TaxID=3345959 RepID=UPI0036CA3D52